MDLWCVHVKKDVSFLGNTLLEKPISLNSRNNSVTLEIRASRKEPLSDYCRYRSVLVRSTGEKNSGNSNDSSSDSSSSSGSGNNSNAGDGLKRNNPPGSNKSGDTGSPKSMHIALDQWREFRSLLYIHEQAENADSAHNQDKIIPVSKSLPPKWAHPISTPENGSLLVATGKLDGVHTFGRTVILLLRSRSTNPQKGPFGVVINRPLHKKMKDMNPSNLELATTFADCPLHFGGPLDASMFLLSSRENLSGFEEVIPGVYLGSRNRLNEASQLVKKGTVKPQDFRFFMGYAGWQMDQLMEEIESEYWYIAACSWNLLFGAPQNASSQGLWEEVLQLMGGDYSELSRKPRQDI